MRKRAGWAERWSDIRATSDYTGGRREDVATVGYRTAMRYISADVAGDSHDRLSLLYKGLMLMAAA